MVNDPRNSQQSTTKSPFFSTMAGMNGGNFQIFLILPSRSTRRSPTTGGGSPSPNGVVPFPNGAVPLTNGIELRGAVPKGAVPFIQAPRSSMPFSRTGPWESIGRTPENCNCGTNFYRPYGISKLDSLTKSSFFESFALCRHLIISCKKSIIQSNDRNIAATTTTTHKTSSPSSSPFLSFPSSIAVIRKHDNKFQKIGKHDIFDTASFTAASKSSVFGNMFYEICCWWCGIAAVFVRTRWQCDGAMGETWYLRPSKSFCLDFVGWDGQKRWLMYVES